MAERQSDGTSISSVMLNCYNSSDILKHLDQNEQPLGDYVYRPESSKGHYGRQTGPLATASMFNYLNIILKYHNVTNNSQAFKQYRRSKFLWDDLTQGSGGYMRFGLKMTATGLLALAFSSSCADNGSLSGEQRKEAKADKPASDNTNATNGTVSQPQVVTGAYLSCVPDQAPDTRAGESAYGCGVYDNVNLTKIDMTNRSLQLNVSDPSGNMLPSRSAAAALNSPYQQYLFATGDMAANTISAKVISGSTVVFSSQTRPIIVTDLSSGLAARNRSPLEIAGWCNVITAQPDNFSSMTSLFTKGVACGASYLCTHGYQGNLVTCTLGGLSEWISSLTGSQNSAANAGICLDSNIPNNALFATRCK